MGRRGECRSSVPPAIAPGTGAIRPAAAPTEWNGRSIRKWALCDFWNIDNLQYFAIRFFQKAKFRKSRNQFLKIFRKSIFGFSKKTGSAQLRNIKIYVTLGPVPPGGAADDPAEIKRPSR